MAGPFPNIKIILKYDEFNGTFKYVLDQEKE